MNKRVGTVCWIRRAVWLGVFIVSPSLAWADETPDAPLSLMGSTQLGSLSSFEMAPHESQPAGGQAGEESDDEVEHRHELALILAGTYEGDEETSYFTTGVEYQYRIRPLLGVGAAIELVVEGDAREYVFVFPVYFHPVEAVELLVAPGVEHSVDDDDSFLFRAGFSYEFEFGERYSISPGVELDFIDGEDGVSYAVVYGVNLEIGF